MTATDEKLRKENLYFLAQLSRAIHNLRESYFTVDFRITPQDPDKEIVPVSYAVFYVKIPHKRNLCPR